MGDLTSIIHLESLVVKDSVTYGQVKIKILDNYV